MRTIAELVSEAEIFAGMRDEQPIPETTATFSGLSSSIASALVIAESTE